jgi:hypothetical protein
LTGPLDEFSDAEFLEEGGEEEESVVSPDTVDTKKSRQVTRQVARQATDRTLSMNFRFTMVPLQTLFNLTTLPVVSHS